jgi:hypothetical protein
MRPTAAGGFQKTMSCDCRNQIIASSVLHCRMMKLLAVATLVAMCGASRGELLNARMYSEMCDASAAVALDDKHFAVADDEGNTLRIYKRGEEAPVREYDVGKFLGNKKRTESDLEGAARVGDRIYWISSHGRNREGQVEEHRHRFFATQIEGKKGLKLEPIGGAYTNLLEDLLADERLKGFGLERASLLAPKHQGGLNIESMCARADGSLLIGFRTPVPQGKGLIVPLLNPDKVIEGGERAKFGEMIALDLGGFGIRDMAQDDHGFLILASAVHGPHIFRLYYWDGKNEKPEVVSREGFEGWNPEALFRFPDDPAGLFQVLSDDGRHMGGGRPCKDFPKEMRRFRAGELKIELPKR